MKKFYFFAVALIATSTISAQTSADSLTFESFDLQDTTFYNGTLDQPNIQIGTFNLTNSKTYNADWQMELWNGFAVSKVSNDATPGFGNQFASYAGSGANNSVKYGIMYGTSTISFGEDRKVASIDLTNATYAALTIKDGDDFTAKFEAGDWFLVNIIPLNANDELAGDTVKFYLADYRSANATEHYIVKNWTTVDMNDVAAAKLKFELSSSDVGDYGMNTPAYMAIDNVALQPKDLSVASLNTLATSVYPNPSNGLFTIAVAEKANLSIVNTFGQLVKTQVIDGTTKVDASNLPAGMYTISVAGTTGTSIQKLIIR